MDFVAPVLMFVIGFGGALLIRRVVSTRHLGGGSARLPVEKGAVRLEEMGKKRRKPKRSG